MHRRKYSNGLKLVGHCRIMLLYLAIFVSNLLLLGNRWVVAWLPTQTTPLFSFRSFRTKLMSRYSNTVWKKEEEDPADERFIDSSTLTVERLKCAGVDSFDADTRQALRKCKNTRQIQQILRRICIMEQKQKEMNMNETRNKPTYEETFYHGPQNAAEDETTKDELLQGFQHFILYTLRPRVAVTALRSWINQSPMFRLFSSEMSTSRDYYFLFTTGSSTFQEKVYPTRQTLTYDGLNLPLLLFQNIQMALLLTAKYVVDPLDSSTLESNTNISSLLDVYSLADMIYILAQFHIYQQLNIKPPVELSHSLNIHMDGVLDQIYTIISSSSLLPMNSRSTALTHLHPPSSLYFISSIGIHRLVSTFCALTIFSHAPQLSPLLQSIASRLEKGDATGQFSALEATQLVGAIAMYSSQVRRIDHPNLLKAILRILRKQHVRRDMTLINLFYALNSTRRILESCDDDGISSMYMEAETFCYTILKEIASRLDHPTHLDSSTVLSDGNRIVTESYEKSRLSARHFGDILSSCVYFDIPNHKIDPIMRYFIYNLNSSAHHPCSMEDIDYILENAKYLNPRLGAAVDPVDRDNSTLLELVNGMGKHFLLAASGMNYSQSCIHPQALSNILHSVSELFPYKYKQMNSYFKATMIIISHHSQLIYECDDIQLSHITVALSQSGSSISHYFVRNNIFQKLARRILDQNSLKQLSSESASLILWSMANIFENPHYQQLVGSEESGSIRRLLFDLFHKLSPSLLVQTISAMHCSRAMWAMAKASYASDTGIFDHLAERMAHHVTFGTAEVRDVSQSLWACAKMLSWEDPLRDELRFGAASLLPYLSSASEMALYLSHNTNLMSSKDIAQAIWACGRLKISNSAILYPLGCAATKVEQFNSQEIANSLWGLAKVDFHKELDHRELIFKLSKKSRERHIIDRCSPQEASNILYALAKMNIADKETFAAMTGVIVSQLTDATAQTIANTLWAHECVRIKPPRAMLDLWAKEKLDIPGLYFEDDDSR